MDISQETSNKIGELQAIEHQLQGFLVQKQSIQVELNEVVNALDEVRKSKEEVYKILSSVMIKTEKDSLIEELEERKNLLELRINSLEKQEDVVAGRASKLRDEVTKEIKKDKNKK